MRVALVRRASAKQGGTGPDTGDSPGYEAACCLVVRDRPGERRLAKRTSPVFLRDHRRPWRAIVDLAARPPRDCRSVYLASRAAGKKIVRSNSLTKGFTPLFRDGS